MTSPSHYPHDQNSDIGDVLLQDFGHDQDLTGTSHSPTQSATNKLYLSHCLSTWNSRVFEFGAVLYLGAIYPATLLPMSIYAFARGLSAIVFAPATGQYIDTTNRLEVVRLSIVVQRLAVAVSCAIFAYLSIFPTLESNIKSTALAGLAMLACCEKLGSMVNIISVERDWVVAMASHDQVLLRRMNSQMRRIDLFCKLLGPLFIALIAGVSTVIAITVNLGMNILSIPIEYIAIARVYREMPQLHRRGNSTATREADTSERNSQRNSSRRLWTNLRTLLDQSVADFTLYSTHHTLLPSIAGALLYLTVLSFAGQMVTYLLTVGYNATQIGVVRTVSTVLEISATWIAPWSMSRIGPVRAGLWFSSWQVATLLAGTAVYFSLTAHNPVASAGALVGGTILSRVGLWGFDLCVQLIVQEEVEDRIRGRFSAVEAAWQNWFELLSFIATMVFPRPEQFHWPVLLSLLATGAANAAYAGFVHGRRGHLIHPTKLKRTIFPSVEEGNNHAGDRGGYVALQDRST